MYLRLRFIAVSCPYLTTALNVFMSALYSCFLPIFDYSYNTVFTPALILYSCCKLLHSLTFAASNSCPVIFCDCVCECFDFPAKCSRLTGFSDFFPRKYIKRSGFWCRLIISLFTLFCLGFLQPCRCLSFFRL